METLAPVTSLAQHRLNRLLDRCRNGFLQPLSATTRARLEALIEAPSQETWDDAKSIIINGRNTVWQALIDHTEFRTDGPRHVVEDFGAMPFRGSTVRVTGAWNSVPTPEQLLVAIAGAVDEPAAAWMDDDDTIRLV